MTLEPGEIPKAPKTWPAPIYTDDFEESEVGVPWGPSGIPVSAIKLGTNGYYRILGPKPGDVDYMKIVLAPLP
jgi:hypothetical protein